MTMSRVLGSEADAGASNNPARDSFLEALHETQALLTALSVDYRIIGSVGSASLAQTSVVDGSLELDFNRPGAYTPDQRVPDIDIVLPRADIAVGREIRTALLKRARPVKLGIASSIDPVDFRPGESESFLTHGKLKHPFDTHLFAPQTARLGPVEVQTLSPDALLHTFVTIGGLMRLKDMHAARALSKLSHARGTEHVPYEPFHDFISQRDAQYPGVRWTSQVRQAAESRLNPLVYNFSYSQALKIASLLRLR